MYSRNNPVSYGDDNGEVAHILGAALVGAAISAGAELFIQAITGQEINGAAIISEAVGGALFGAIATATGNIQVAEIVSVGASSVVSGCIAGENVKTVFLNAAIEMVGTYAIGKIFPSPTGILRDISPNGSWLSRVLYQGKHLDYTSTAVRFDEAILNQTVNTSVHVIGSIGSALFTPAGNERTQYSGVKDLNYWMKYYA